MLYLFKRTASGIMGMPAPLPMSANEMLFVEDKEAIYSSKYDENLIENSMCSL